MSSDEIQGYPIRRNNSCSTGESTCGTTWGTFHACCPESSECVDSQITQVKNFICCSNALNCATILADAPTCADTSWDLYNSTGYFCCESQHPGFDVQGAVSVGCLDPDAPRNDSYNALKASSIGTPSTTATSTSASISTSASVSTSASISTSTSILTSSSDAGTGGSDTSSSTNTGAIAGGVVGGVVGVAAIAAAVFFLIRRRKRQQQQQQFQSEAPPPPFPVVPLEKDASQPKELGDGHVRVELEETGKHSTNGRFELPASS